MLGKLLLLYQKVKISTTTKPKLHPLQVFLLTLLSALRHCKSDLVYSTKVVTQNLHCTSASAGMYPAVCKSIIHLCRLADSDVKISAQIHIWTTCRLKHRLCLRKQSGARRSNDPHRVKTVEDLISILFVLQGVYCEVTLVWSCRLYTYSRMATADDCL